jgi:aryl-alcohol dehydrogenase-like predicted oxidoreductase
MKLRFLGKTGLMVSEICLGTANFMATGAYAGTGRIEQSDANRIVAAARDAGINFFNTAETYSDGNSETSLGKALGANRSEAIIISKVHPAHSPRPNDGGLSRKHIIEGCEASLKRLGTDYIDIYQFHMFDDHTPLEVTIRAMDDLVRSGKVRYIGCSNFSGWQLMKSLDISRENGWERFVTLEAMYSLVSRWAEFELVPLCLDQGVSLLAFSPLHGGFLSGKYRRNAPFPAGTRFLDMKDTGPWPVEPEKLYDIIGVMEAIAADRNATVSQVALNYLLRKPAVNSLIIGVRTIKHLEENLKAMDWEITPGEVARLDKISEPVRYYPYFIHNAVTE